MMTRCGDDTITLASGTLDIGGDVSFNDFLRNTRNDQKPTLQLSAGILNCTVCII